MNWIIWVSIFIYIFCAVIVGCTAFIADFLVKRKYDYYNFLVGILWPILFSISIFYIIISVLWEPIHLLIAFILKKIEKDNFVFKKYYFELWCPIYKRKK